MRRALTMAGRGKCERIKMMPTSIGNGGVAARWLACRRRIYDRAEHVQHCSSSCPYPLARATALSSLHPRSRRSTNVHSHT